MYLVGAEESLYLMYLLEILIMLFYLCTVIKIFLLQLVYFW